MMHDDVKIKPVYQISCRICHQDAVEGETYDFYSDAEAAQQDHIAEHRETER